jgi:hypothetical protein
MVHRTGNETVEVLVGVVLHGEFHGKRLRFTGREVDRYDTSESRHVLYECGPGRYRILVSRFDDGSEIYPEPDMAVETGGLSYGFFTSPQAAARWPHKEHFAHFFPVENVEE